MKRKTILSLIVSLLNLSCVSKDGLIKQIVLFNTHGLTITNVTELKNNITKDISFSFENTDVIKTISSAQQKDDMYLWKGEIYGCLIFDDGDSALIKISRYGGFFKRLDSGKYYIITDKDLKPIWQSFIDSFITEHYK
jgi:hypothetical protein